MIEGARIVHLTSVHFPLDTRIFHKECKSILSAGYDICLIAPYDNSMIVDGIQICAVKRPRGRFDRVTRTLYSIYHAARFKNGQIYHFHDPELIIVGIALKLAGKRVIYDVHEDVPNQVLVKYWIKPVLRKGIAKGVALVERTAMKMFDGFVVATPVIAKRFPPDKTVIVQNFPKLDALQMQTNAESPGVPPIIAYVGAISAARGIKEMVQAIGLIPKEYNCQAIMAGKFSSAALEGEIKSMPQWQQIRFLGWQSQDAVKELLRKAQVGLVVLHPTRSYVVSQPVKLFEYMAAGIPVIASDFPLWRDIVDGAQCGLLVDPLKPESIARAICWILDNPQQARRMGENGRRAVLEKYNWDHEAAKLLNLYHGMLS